MIKLIITDKEIEVYGHHNLNIYRAEVLTADSTWIEVFASRDLLDTFVRGVRAGAAAANKSFDIQIEDKTG